MQKGERRKLELMAAASDLFGRQGYQATNIADILELVGCSKGSFYHHFESKMALFNALVDQRSLYGYKAFEEENSEDSLGKLDRLLYFASPLRKGEEGFLASLLSKMEPQDEAIMQAHMCDSLKRSFYADYLALAYRLHDMGQLRCANRALPELLWDSHMAFTLTILGEWQRVVASGGTPASRVIELLQAGRLMWERLLDLPYGSVNLVPAEELLKALGIAQKHLQSGQRQLRFDAGYAAPCQQVAKPI